MGYFSNGTEGECYQSRYCNKCYHDQTGGCRIWLAHLLFAYSGTKEQKEVLNLLIPRNKDGGNGQCESFVDIETVKRRREAEAKRSKQPSLFTEVPE